MNTDPTEPESDSPWLSWAVTAAVTLAGVLLFAVVANRGHKPPRQVAAAPETKPTATPKAESKNEDSPRDSAAPVAVPASPQPPTAKPADSSAAPTLVEQPSTTEQPAPLVENPVPSAGTAAVEANPAPATPPVSQSEPLPAATDPPPSTSPPATTPATAPATAPPADTSPADTSPAETPKAAPKLTTKSPPAADTAKAGAFARTAAEVRAAMAKRDLAASKRQLKTLAGRVQNAAQQAELERLQILQDHLEQFWDGVRGAVARFQPAEEIVLNDRNRVAVVESSRDELMVQMEGKPRRFKVEALPMDLLSAISKASFKPTPGSKLIVGSFLAMDAQGNRAEARKLWQEAIRGGEDQGKLLLPELGVPLAGGKTGMR